MEVFRLARRAYALPLSGIGAALKGARWNSAGVEMIYSAANRSLAMAEVAVHFSLATLPHDFLMLTIHIPDDVLIEQLPLSALPPGWRDFPHPAATQTVGDRFVLAGRAAVLRVPSVVTQGDFNLLINPRHADFSRIQVIDTAPFPFDRRIFA